MTFEVEEAEYEALTVSDPTFPPYTFAMLADSRRVEAYQAALQRAVLRLRGAGEGALLSHLIGSVRVRGQRACDDDTMGETV